MAEVEQNQTMLANECVPANAVYCANLFADAWDNISDEAKAQTERSDFLCVNSINHISIEDRQVFMGADADKLKKYQKSKIELDVMYASGIVCQRKLQDQGSRSPQEQIEEIDDNDSGNEKMELIHSSTNIHTTDKLYSSRVTKFRPSSNNPLFGWAVSPSIASDIPRL